MNIRAAPSLISFGSKAETLETLKPILKKATILELARVSVREWQHDRAKVLEKLGQTSWLQSTTLIVRSSAAAEDRAGQSLAGHFMSLLNVPFLFLGEAIDQVVTSFAGDASANDEVFIQPMLKATCSGVMFTRDPNTNAPYLVINYEDRGDTTAVTSGNSNQLKTHVYWKGSRITCPLRLIDWPPWPKNWKLCSATTVLMWSLVSIALEFYTCSRFVRWWWHRRDRQQLRSMRCFWKPLRKRSSRQTAHILICEASGRCMA